MHCSALALECNLNWLCFPLLLNFNIFRNLNYIKDLYAMSRYKSSEIQPIQSHRRQNTQRERFSRLAGYLSSCLGFGGRQVTRRNTMEFGDPELQLDKCLVERALCKHFDDPSIMVLYFRFSTWRYMFSPRFASWDWKNVNPTAAMI